MKITLPCPRNLAWFVACHFTGCLLHAGSTWIFLGCDYQGMTARIFFGRVNSPLRLHRTVWEAFWLQDRGTSA